MSVEVLNLDNLIPEDKKVQFMGEVLIIPGKMSVSYMFESLRTAQKLQANPNDFDTQMAAFDSLFDLLKKKNPNIDKETFINNMTSEQYVALINFVNDQYTPKEGKETEEKKTNE